MKSVLALLILFCVGFVLSEAYYERSHRPHSQSHRREEHEAHRYSDGFDKYAYFYNAHEGRSHGRLFEGHHAGHAFGKKQYCKPTDPCWPTTDELTAVFNALNPNLPRSLVYHGLGTPLPCAVPIDSPDNQPLYGEGISLAPAAINDAPDEVCFVNYNSQFCRLTVRNNPLENWSPAFVAWPTTAAQVQFLVKFATDHNLCISVTNSGHDFLNRHSCEHSLNIRTSLLKEIVWGESPYTVRVGAGVTASELQYEASLVKKSVVTSWTKSIGIVGWSIGGGHGPLSPKLGLGVDQIVGVQLVGPDGCLYTVDAYGTKKKHLDGRVEYFDDSDLLWAVRGGGGSTWGVITSLTLKTHTLPTGGYIGFQLDTVGDFCTGEQDFFDILELYFSWTLTLDSKWGGYAYVTPYRDSGASCNAQWSIKFLYLYQGGDNFLDTWNALLDNIPKGVRSTATYIPFPHVWATVENFKVEPITPVAFLSPSETFPGGLPSVLLSRETVKSGAVLELIKTQIGKCTELHCESWQISHDLTGNINSPQDSDVSISPGMRTSLLQLMALVPTLQDLPLYYALGPHSYFSECAYLMDNWTERLWGKKNYKRLSKIKKAFDEDNVFWCRHCVGDETIRKN